VMFTNRHETRKHQNATITANASANDLRNVAVS
jgi:hypothetical protein